MATKAAANTSDSLLPSPQVLHRKMAGPGAAAGVPPAVEEALRTPWQPLDTATRADMESRFGQDFSRVRVHTDTTAAQSARAVDALAYTVGQDIVFGSRQFAPSSPAGRHLLGHELAHVAQQGGAETRMGGALRLGPAHDAHEAAADRAADAVANGGAVGSVGAASADTVRRAPPGLAPPVGLDLSMTRVELGTDESVTKDNPKLMQVAASYKANSGGAARVHLSADLSSSAKNSSTQETAERSRLNGRMRAIREALKALGVPEDAIDLSPATAYSTSANGQVSVDVGKAPVFNPLLTPPVTAPGILPPAVAPAPQGASGLPSLNLDLKFGPVTVSLPKEARARLPIALRGAKSLVIELGYEVPAKFSFKITLDGTPHVKVSLKAGAEVDAKKGSVTGSAGLQIDTVSTTCNAPDPGETQAKIKGAGDKLNKAAQEFAAASGTDKLGKAFDIASAIGEMYDAVDKAKSKCKQVPRVSIEFGYKHLLSPGSETDPKKLPPTDFFGVTGTFHF